MIRRPPRSTRTDTLFPYTTLFRSRRRPIWFRIRRISGLVRLMSGGGTTRYNETGCGASTRSAMRQSDREVTAPTVGSRYSQRKDMAVESTHERPFSLFLRSWRAADATTGGTLGAYVLSRWLVVLIWRRVAT